MLVSEIFASIQGEGSAQGRPCAFVRLAGCPLRCRWCDTAYARDGGVEMPLGEVVRRTRELGLPLVEITGGEPLMQPDAPNLAQALLDHGHRVLCETSGAFDIGVLPEPIVRVMDLKPPSSGESGRMRWDNLERLRPGDDLKVVIADRDDFDWAVARVERVAASGCNVSFQPAHPLLAPAELAAWILEDRLDVRLQLQLHKLLWPHEERGR